MPNPIKPQHNVNIPESVEAAKEWIGKRVWKRRSHKPFKSGNQINTVKGVIAHPDRPGHIALTFHEDDSYVSMITCELFPPKKGEQNA